MDLPCFYALEGASVRAATASDHARRLREFIGFCGQLLTGKEVDDTICVFFEVKYREGAPAADGSKLSQT